MRTPRHRQPKTIVVKLPALHPAQSDIVTSSARFNVVCAGRRTGKTVLGIDRLVHPALAGKPVAWFSPTYKMLKDVWDRLAVLLLAVTVARNEQIHRLTLLGGGIIDMWSLENADAIRGRKYQRVVIDEAAMVPDLANAWQAIIRPTLTDMRGDGWFLSSPRGRNFFWQCFERGQVWELPSAERGEWRSWRLPTSANPFIDARELEAAQRELPERVYAEEYLAAFLDDAYGVFRGVAAAACAVLCQPQSDHSYVVGVDWARAVGGDYTVFVVVDVTTRTMVAMDRFSGIDYATQLGRLRVLCERWQPVSIFSERNNMGDPLTEQLQREGLPVVGLVATNASKAAWVDALALALERGTITLLPHDVLKGELLSYMGTRLPSGLVRYAAPEGQYDDCVSALLLAWQGVERPGARHLVDFL